jgi:hypothetical protein
MKNRILFVILLLCVLFFSCKTEEFQENLPWDYPVKPGTEEWKKFTSNEEMVAACQIPDIILTSLSTEDLTELCLRYPLLADVFAFYNLQIGLDKLFSDFNGIRELYKRKKVADELLKRYNLKIQNLSFLDGKASNIEKGSYIISISALEILLTRIDGQDNEDKEILKKILQSLVFGYERKRNYEDYFQGLGFRTNFYSRANIIAKIDKLSIELLPYKDKNTVLFSGYVDAETMRVLDELSYQLIK